MKISAELKYIGFSEVTYPVELDVPEGTKAGEVSSLVLKKYADETGYRFGEMNIVHMVGGISVAPSYEMKEGDHLRIRPLMTGG